MKQCPNPECPVHLSGRLFNEDDQICPHCATSLISTTAVQTRREPPRPRPGAARRRAGGGGHPPPGVRYRPGHCRADAERPSRGHHGGRPLTPGPVVPPTDIADTAATQTALVSALPNTPVVVVATPVVFITPLPLNSGTGTGGSINSGVPPVTGVDATGAGATSAVIPGVSAARLCRRIAAGEACEPVSAYGSRDAFNLAVQAGFGTGGARSARVRWYGPNGALLYATEPVVPGRTGTYWVAFTLTQNQPWTQGLYRAEIYLDDVLYRQVDIPVVT